MLLLLDVRDHADWRSRHGYTRFAFFGFLTALRVGGSLARGDFVEGAPLRLHPHMGVARAQDARDMPGDTHDDLETGAWMGITGVQQHCSGPVSCGGGSCDLASTREQETDPARQHEQRVFAPLPQKRKTQEESAETRCRRCHCFCVLASSRRGPEAVP